MRLLSFISSSIFQILSFLFILGYLLGILNVHFSDRNEYCDMTYMFEYPQFVRISVEENRYYPQYGLYAYSEGRFTEKARKMWFDGVPVLFLPGNSGSHMQARSLASVALRKALNKGHEYHFDYFTIGYNEELSGLYGGVLQSQTSFAVDCIAKILSLYKSNKYTKNVPTTVILIGHSMGGVIAKRLLAYPLTLNTTSVAITLAAPLESPLINFDNMINDYYTQMQNDWENLSPKEYDQKVLLSFGNGPRDFLMPSGLTSSKDSYIHSLTTAVPGVWVSPDHVGIVWCKQLVLAINRYLFSVVDPTTFQVSDDRQVLLTNARQYFQANRSMTLSLEIIRPNVTMITEGFWYEDNRRIYQISRPVTEKTTYLMIRLVNLPQNRFAAVESVNVDDKDWIYGCNAMFTYNYYRYCKQATSLTELSRWSGAAKEFGKRKLATIDLHSIKKLEPDWSHVLIKVSPTRKPIILNVDINDRTSRQIKVDLPSAMSFGNTIIKQETEPNSLYYELILPEFNTVYQAYLLYVEPTASCKATQYHVSAELTVPWAKNNEYYHYYTHLKRSPMKLRLYKSNPNITHGLETKEHVKITLLLDPQCTFTISISSTWYHRLAQIARNYTPVLLPYIAAIVLLAARTNVLSLKTTGKCMSMHGALISDGVKPYYALVCSRLAFMLITSVPLLTFLYENASWGNIELHQFSRSLLVIPAYMAALGALHISVAAVLGVMVFSSQLAHRLLFRIMWRGGPSIAEKVASGLQKMPLLVNVALITGVPLSCGAASLVAGAAFYAFLVSKMYEEYLEDYVYKLMAKVMARIYKLFKSKKNKTESETSLLLSTNNETTDLREENKAIESSIVESSKDLVPVDDKNIVNKDDSNNTIVKTEENEIVPFKDKEKDVILKDDDAKNTKDRYNKRGRRKSGEEDDLNNINFHVMMFFMWICVTLVNIPALLTWARNFKYSMVLKPDTSYFVGLLMSACSTCLWQMNGPRPNLKHYDAVATLLFIMAVCILTLGPFSLIIVSYGVTFVYVVMTLQQLCDKEIQIEVTQDIEEKKTNTLDNEKEKSVNNKTATDNSEPRDPTNEPGSSSKEEPSNTGNIPSDDMKRQDSETSEDCVSNENSIYKMFSRLKDKLSFVEDIEP